MAIQYTPALGLPYPEVTDAPKIASRDLRALALRMDLEGSTIKGSSEAALTASQAAEVLAAQAVARAEKVEFPIESGTTPPEDEEKLWVDEGDSSGVSWGDLTGKPTAFPPEAHTHPIADVTGLAARLDALEDPQVTQISTGIYGVGERYTTPISTGIYQIGA